MCRQLFIEECKIFVLSKLNSTLDNNDEETAYSIDEDFYFSLCEDYNSPKSNNISDPLESRHVNLLSLQALTFLNSKKKELNLLDEFPTIKQIFLKYNTTIPSSAPVERLFSGAVQVYTGRRNCFGDKTFEMLCCKSNV
jgi:hypothetical protein